MLERWSRELAGCGFAGSIPAGHSRQLTPPEFAVAHLVARGVTNREWPPSSLSA